MAKINTPKATESCALGNIARPTPAIRSATRIAGKDSITSHRRMRKVSSQPPLKPASRPRLTPTSIERMTEAALTTREMRAP